MKYLFKFKKGDISLIVTLLVCSIVLILLTPLAQKVSVESQISRENLMSQQAIQAAKTGLDSWKYRFTNGSTTPSSDTDWTSLDSSLGIEYKVIYYTDSINPPYIISTGRVNRGNFTIERSLEEKFTN